LTITKAKPNRITISIMNLWVNRIGQLAMLAVALFFYSCEDETSLLGFKNPTSQFDVRYIDLEIDTRQLLDTAVRTSNLYYAGEPNRFLVGSYVDPDFGTITSSAYTQFLTATFAKLDSIPVLDSISLKLTFDEYMYSLYTNDKKYNETPQKLSVYVLKDSLDERLKENYHFGTPVAYDPDSLLGSKQFNLGTATFGRLDDLKNETFSITVPLSKAWGEKIFASAKLFADATRGTQDKTRWRDSAFVKYPNEFHKQFKGIAIVPEKPGAADNDKVYGISGGASRIILHYHTLKKDGFTIKDDSLQLPLAFDAANYMVSYNNITADRSGSELETVQPNKPVDLDRRYVESGQGLTVEFDFSKVVEFADTIPNILIQSATLSIEDVDDDSYLPPGVLTLRALNIENRRTKFFGSTQDQLDVQMHNSFIYPDVNQGGVLVDLDSSIYIRNDANSGALLSYDDDTEKYAGSIGGFLQQIVKKYNGRTQYLRFALYPAGPTALKKVDRAVFDKAKVRLRIYYVKPTVNTK
jgi:hypothetical protein